MKHYVSASTFAVALALSPLTSSASLVGDTVGCAFGPGTVNCSSATAVVGAGVEFGLFLGGDRLFDIDLSASSLKLTLVDRLALTYSTDLLVLSGLDFSGFPGGITGLNVDISGNTGINNVGVNDFSFTSNSLTVDFRNWGYPNNPASSVITVDFLTNPVALAVPEPGALALTVLALSALAAVSRRTAAAKRAVR